MHCQISERFEYCIAGGKVILLDLQLYRYRGVPAAVEPHIVALIKNGGRGEVCDPNYSDLLSLGIIEESRLQPHFSRKTTIAAVSTDFATTRFGAPSLTLIACALWWQLRCAIHLRTRPFPTVMRQLRDWTPPPSLSLAASASKVDEVAAAFDRTGYFLGDADRCLVRSLAMFFMFRSLGVRVDLVIGVRSSPFLAHCWIQQEAMVLNDTVEHVRHFTPILVI